MLTGKEHRAHARERGLESFKNHVITTIVDDKAKRVHVFKCATPDNSNHLKFYISILPGAVLIHGDIGDTLINHPSGGIDWVLDSVESTEYFLGKGYGLEETQFLEGDADAYLNDDEWRDAETRVQIRNGWRRSGSDEEIGRSWDEAVYEVTGDSEFPRCRDYDFEILWCYEAIRWWAKNYKAPVEEAAMSEREYWQWRCGVDSAWNFRTRAEAEADHERQRVYSSHTYRHCSVKIPVPFFVEPMSPGE